MGIRSDRILGAPTPSLVRSEAPTSSRSPRNRENTVEGSSQGSAYPGHRSTHPIGARRNTPDLLKCRDFMGVSRGPKPRKNCLPEAAAGESSDAAKVRERVETTPRSCGFVVPVATSWPPCSSCCAAGARSPTTAACPRSSN
jgi:hypothetical protein